MTRDREREEGGRGGGGRSIVSLFFFFFFFSPSLPLPSLVSIITKPLGFLISIPSALFRAVNRVPRLPSTREPPPKGTSNPPPPTVGAKVSSRVHVSRSALFFFFFFFFSLLSPVWKEEFKEKSCPRWPAVARVDRKWI